MKKADLKFLVIDIALAIGGGFLVSEIAGSDDDSGSGDYLSSLTF